MSVQLKGEFFPCSCSTLFFGGGQVPSAAITAPVELRSAPAPLQVQEAKLMAFGSWGCCAWLWLLDEHLLLLQWLQ